ncbi:MAG: 4-hydroxythreonine-4-phosphate dehydrogenase PdxA [Puniceicoccales bacterium]|jgi:4-hydroxythreonine-4-phosphate dehydrogenase|nr:4-hydroxythreonine-4-phosphate dehydrogenase PdxA [Puniceicoccales bacterium]
MNPNAKSPAPSEKPLALLCGDPAGVGPEIIAKWLAAAPENREGVVAVGHRRWLDTLPVAGVAVGDADFAATAGAPDAAGQRVALAALEAGAAGCREGRFRAVVTGPVSKARLAAEGYPFPGQTEFFASRWGGTPVMAFAGGRLRVALATWHIPFASVPAALTPSVLERAVAAADFLARRTGAGGVAGAAGAVPRIGVCGLNPHAGEEGLLGADERDRLDPWLGALREKFPGVSRCQPADSLFHRHLAGEFDAVVALYHDQGLAPLKTLEFDRSVNITLGLPFARTSPDHGTAYGIAGTGTASTASWDAAVRLARLLAA